MGWFEGWAIAAAEAEAGADQTGNGTPRAVIGFIAANAIVYFFGLFDLFGKYFEW